MARHRFRVGQIRGVDEGLVSREQSKRSSGRTGRVWQRRQAAMVKADEMLAQLSRLVVFPATAFLLVRGRPVWSLTPAWPHLTSE